jgi:uncharacterized protein with PIN domain
MTEKTSNKLIGAQALNCSQCTEKIWKLNHWYSINKWWVTKSKLTSINSKA